MAGRIQNEDVKTLAELTGAGGSASQLINDTKIYVTANALNKQLSQAITDGDIGGGGGGGINFIVNGNAENATINNFVTYNDGAVSRPIDGTGGTPTITNVSRSIASPILYQNASWRFVKPASNVQGQGWSVPFTVQDGFMSKAIKIRFLYQVVTGTFTAGSLSADSDLIVYLYDVTNSKLIEPTNFKLYSNSSTISDVFEGEFQTSATGTSYRLIFHLATTTTNGWTLAVDEIEVSPSEYIFGTSIGNTTPFTPTLSNNTGVSANTANYRFSGDHIEVNGRVLFNATGAGAEFSVSLPPGMSVDSTKTATVPDETSFGIFQYKDNGVQFRTGNIVYASANTVRFNLDSSTQSILGTGLTSGDTLNYIYRIPIAGLQSSTKMSDGYDGRVIALSVGKSTSQSITTTPADITGWATPDEDTTASFNTTTGVWTCPSSGWYAMQGSIAAQNTGTFSYLLRMQINGVTVVSGLSAPNAVESTQAITPLHIDYITAGTTIKLHASVNTGTQGTRVDVAANRLTIWKLNNSQTTSSNSTVAVRATKSDGSSFNGGTVKSFNNKLQDTHNAYNTSTGLFAAPDSGFYQISSTVEAASASYVAPGGNAAMWFVAAGVEVWGNRVLAQTNYTGVVLLTSSALVYLKAGETLGVATDASPTTTFTTSTARNVLSIHKVGL